MIAGAVGGLALLCVLGWPFFTDYRTVVKIQSVGAAAFALYFLMLGSPTAAIACLISCTQLGTSIYRWPNRHGDDSLVPWSGSERCGNRGFSGYRTI